MTASRWERLAPLTGVAFVVLTVAGIILSLSGSPEDFPAPVEEIVQYYEEESGTILAASWLGLVGSFFLIWFGGSVRARLQDAGEERLGTVAFGGAVMAAAMGALVDTANMIAALRADDEDLGGIGPETATTMYDLANGMLSGGLAIGVAVFIAATSVAAFRSGAVPMWLAGFGTLVTIGLLIPPIAWAVTALALLWALITSIVLYTSQPAPPAAAGASTG